MPLRFKGFLTTVASNLVTESNLVQLGPGGAIISAQAPTIGEGEEIPAWWQDWWIWLVVGLSIGVPVILIIVVCCVRARKRKSDYLRDRARLRPRDALNKPNMQIVSPGSDPTPLQLDRAKVCRAFLLYHSWGGGQKRERRENNGQNNASKLFFL